MPEFVSYACALFFAWLLGVSAWHKWRDGAYYRQLLRSWFGREPGVSGVRVLALLEFAIALSLLLPASRYAALLSVAVLLVLYAGIMGWLLLRGRGDLKCGCAGPATNTRISASLVWRNLLCAQLALLAAEPVGATAAMSAPGAMLTLLIAAFLCLLYLCCDQLLSNAQHVALEKR